MKILNSLIISRISGKFFFFFLTQGYKIKEGGKPLSHGPDENIEFINHLPHFRQNNLFYFFSNLRLQF